MTTTPSLMDILCDEKESMTSNQHLRLLLLFNEEKIELRKRKFRKILEQEYQLEKLGPLFSKLKSMENTYAQELKEKTAEAHQNGYCWCTINPKEGISFDNFRKKIEKIVKYSCFKGHAYVFEQRGTVKEGNIGKGFHAHLLFSRNLSYKPKDLEQRIRRGCKGIVGNVNNNNFINLAKIGKDYAIDKYKYMTASKKLEKQEKQIGDIQFRKIHNLRKIYINNISLDIINAQEQKKDNSTHQKNG